MRLGVNVGLSRPPGSEYNRTQPRRRKAGGLTNLRIVLEREPR